MRHRTTGAIGLTAVEVVLALLVLSALFGLGTWIISNRQRRELTNLAIHSPAQVFEFECRYLDEPTRMRSIACAVSNPTRYSLPLMYRANSFLGQREGESYDGLPITSQPSDNVSTVAVGYLGVNAREASRVLIAPGGNASFELFSEYPLREGAFLVVMTPVAQQAPGVTTVVGTWKGAAASAAPEVAGSGAATTHMLLPSAPEVRNLYYGKDWLTFVIGE